MKTSKSIKKIAKKKSLKQKAGASPKQEKRIPNAGIIKVIQKKIGYASMWKAIQQIAQPVSFESLKQFYNIGK